MTSGWVIVTGPPRVICSRNSGTTEPDAETDHAEGGSRIFAGRRLYDQLRHAFGCAHDVGGAHRLVGGNEHEGGHAGARCRAARGQGAENIVFRAFGDIGFHDGHVFVRGCVIDGFNTVALEDALHLLLVLHVAEQGYHLGLQLAGGAGGFQFAPDFVEAVFAAIDQHQPPRTVGNNLPAQLRADRAAGARYRHHLVGDAAGQQFGLRWYRRASEQILDFDIADVVDLREAGYQRGKGRDGLDLYGQFGEIVENLPAP